MTLMEKTTLDIRPDKLTHPQVLALLEQHLREMSSQSPPESVHALDVASLRKSGIRFWAAWDGDNLAGVAALMQLDAGSAEIKSMRSCDAYRRQGVAYSLLHHLITIAREDDVQRVYLETGSMPAFNAARALYRKANFKYCEPFADYKKDPNSVYMKLDLRTLSR